MRLRFCSTRGKPGWWEDESGNEVELISNCISDVKIDYGDESHLFVVIIRRTGTGRHLLDELVIGNDTLVGKDWNIDAFINEGDHRVITGTLMIHVTKFITFSSESVLKSWWEKNDRVI